MKKRFSEEARFICVDTAKRERPHGLSDREWEAVQWVIKRSRYEEGSVFAIYGDEIVSPFAEEGMVSFSYIDVDEAAGKQRGEVSRPYRTEG